MKKKNWLDFVRKEEIKEFFQKKIDQDCNIKILNNEKYGKIVKVIAYQLNYDDEVDIQKYNLYFYEYGELVYDKTNVNYFLIPEEYPYFIGNSEINFTQFIAKKTKDIKINGKTYLDCFKEAMTNELEKNYKKDLKQLNEDYTDFLNLLNKSIKRYEKHNNELEK